MSMTRKQLIEAAFKHVYPPGLVEELISAAAAEHTIANLGQSLEQLISTGNDWGNVYTAIIPLAYARLREESASEGIDIEDEYQDWLKQARKDVAQVQKKGLPLTLENVRMAFEMKGPFAKKKKK
jgi:hypothetical protein